ncbi:hypothetical protein FQN54_000845 [Arachnomyces sp. PD_36]|nr:hypothetical protein FQN54_000845 [Arachnomyces sp. PD_36]
MPAPSLFQLAQRKAMRSIRAIPDVGLVPYNLLKPILAKVESAEHLRSLELKSPHIEEDNADLWINFIKRDVPGWDQIELPSNPACWYDVYRELMERAKEELDRDAQKMKSALEELTSDRAKNTARVVDPHTLRFLPKERPTMKQRYAAHDRKMGGLTPVFAVRGESGTAGDMFETPKLPRGGAGRSSTSSGLFAPVKRKKALSVPTHQLTSRATPIRQAPRAFVNDHKLAAQVPKPTTTNPSPAVSRGRVIAPGRQRGPRLSTAPISGSALEEREARLRNLMSSKPKPAPIPHPAPKQPTDEPSQGPSPAKLPRQITLLGCSSPSTPPRRITRVQTSPTRQKSTSPTSSKLAKSTDTTSADTQLSPPPPPSSKPTTTAPTTSSPPAANKPSPAPPMIRKRPPPQIFIQPKKRKVV